MVRNTLIVSRFLGRYLVRKVCSRGVLRNPLFRGLALFLVVALLVVSTIVGFVFYRSVSEKTQVVGVIVGLDNLALPLWVGVAFCSVRLLFLVSSGTLDICERLPVTKAQRSVAVLLVELFVVSLVLVAVLFSSLAPLPLIYGPSAFPVIATGMVYPGAVMLLLFVVGFNLVDALFSRLFVKRISGILALTCCLLVTVLSQVGLASRLSDLTMAYQYGEDYFVPTDIFTWLSGSIGFALTTLLALVATMVLAALAVVTGGATFKGGARYIYVVACSSPRVFTAHLWALLRSQETWISAFVGLALLIYFGSTHLLPVTVAVEPLAFLGIYLYSSTASIRKLPVVSLSATRAYALLVASVAVLVVPFLVFAGCVDMLVNASLLATVLGGLGCLVSIPLFVTLGVVIPMERDNPIGVLVGLSLALTVLVFLVLALSIFRLPAVGWAVLGLVGVVVACLLGIREMKASF